MTTRIIAGVAGGRRLQTPRGDLTRPTTDRVREALFSALQSSLGSFEEVRFLDLYAGSGAVGLEAWSRGAATVTLVEQDRRTASLISRNARDVGFASAEVVCSSVARHLASGAPTAYDVVFLDPPYAHPAADLVSDLTALAARGWLVDGALVVVERGARDAARGRGFTWPEGFEAGRVRTYGETALASATWPGP
jgi:16S rRNA (guanine966-N2)-methyltransferase